MKGEYDMGDGYPDYSVRLTLFILLIGMFHEIKSLWQSDPHPPLHGKN